MRARETGHIIAEKLRVPFGISDALREFDCGSMEGRNDNLAWATHKAAIQSWEDKGDYLFRIPPDGESFEDVKTRFLPFIEKLLEENSDTNDILLIGHGGTLQLMLPLVLANVDRSFIKQHPLRNCERVVAQSQNTRLVCTEWAGQSLLQE